MEYFSEIVSFIAGIITGGVAVKIHINRSMRTQQSGNKVGGDMAGRDINKG